MSGTITGFRISGLHGRRNVSIPIRDNCVVLVGVNGLGKTTIINLLYYLLSRQWARLVEYEFDAIAIDVDGEPLSISRSAIEGPLSGLKTQRRISRLYPQFARVLSRDPRILTTLATAPTDPAFLRSLAEDLHVPYPIILSLRQRLLEDPLQQEFFSIGEALASFEKALESSIHGQVLYLPTYRRIERDLEKLFPGLEDQIQKKQTPLSGNRLVYLEFVEFGMRDVEKRFAELLASLKERARSELNKLAASYLREVIRGEADTYDTTLVESLDADAISRILNRVEERDILDAPDKKILREVISKLKTAGKDEIYPNEKYVGHFFSKLVSIHASLATAESAVEGFVQVCNRYLVGKKITFDDRNYDIRILDERNGVPLELKHLSSGEKQIVSLFTHVYLGDAQKLLVLIDEPELSLSVPWQKQLLPDIRRSGKCDFLAAVTHSPFIYDNELLEHATDLRECITDV